MSHDHSTAVAQERLPFDRIILLVDEFPPAIAGGIATWAYELSETLSARGHRVIVMAPRKVLRKSGRPRCAAEVRYIGWHDWARYRGLYCLLGVLPLCRTRNQRLLIVGSTWQHLTAITLVRSRINAKLICFSHGTDATRAITPPRRRRFERVLRNIDMFLPTSGFLKRMVETAFPGVSVPIRIVYNGLDVTHFRPLREEKRVLRTLFGLDQEAFVVVSAGRMIKAKGFDTLVEAMALATRRTPKAHLCIAGKRDGEYENLAALAASLGISDRVTFTGGIPYDKLPLLYNAADVAVLASVPLHEPYYIEDNFPMALLEAAGCGLPLIGTVCGGIPEIVENGRCGFVVPPRDAAALASCITALAADDALAARMGRAARERAELHFRRELMTDRFIEAASGRDVL